MSTKLSIHRFTLNLIVFALLSLLITPIHAQDTGASGQIIFALAQQSPNIVHIMNTDGSNLRPLNDRGTFENNPKLSHDSALIAYVGEDGQNHEVFVMNVDGSNPRQVTKLGIRFAPTFAWLGDNQRLAVQYFDSATNKARITIFNLDGEATDEITIPGIDVISSVDTWFNDGETLMFEATVPVANGSIRTLFTVRWDGANLKPLTPDTYTSSAVLSPDGTQIAYINLNTPGESDLYIMDTNGSNAHAVNIGDQPDMQVSSVGWSPDATQLVIAATLSSQDGLSQLYIINTDGSGLQQLTTLEQHEPFSPPVWIPSVSSDSTPEATPAS